MVLIMILQAVIKPATIQLYFQVTKLLHMEFVMVQGRLTQIDTNHRRIKLRYNKLDISKLETHERCRLTAYPFLVSACHGCDDANTKLWCAGRATRASWCRFWPANPPITRTSTKLSCELGPDPLTGKQLLCPEVSVCVGWGCCWSSWWSSVHCACRS